MSVRALPPEYHGILFSRNSVYPIDLIGFIAYNADDLFTYSAI